METRHKWFKTKNLKCIILAAGKGSRLLTLTKKNPKPMVNIVEKPMLNYVIDYWKKYTDDFIFVVNYKKDKIINYVKKFKGINYQFIIQHELRGIADALLTVESVARDKFIVVLGDCICKGSFNFHPELEQGIGVWETDNINDIKNSYAVKIESNLIQKVREKPKKTYNNFCGLGFYFFDKRVFNYIKNTPPSKLRNEIELTDVIQNMIKGKEKIFPAFLKGEYLNINTKEELNRARKIIHTSRSKSRGV